MGSFVFRPPLNKERRMNELDLSYRLDRRDFGRPLVLRPALALVRENVA
jgi:hypothetical protein